MKLRKNLVFGLGPGRCGSASLAWLLNEQEGALVTHEMFPTLPWETGDNSAIQFRWEQLHHQSHLHHTVGDVGSYYLSWVEFLMDSWEQVPHLNNEFNFRFIVLQRPVEELVESFLTKFEKQKNNPLQNHDGSKWESNEWDLCFPKYNGVTLKEAIQSYCQDYYEKAQSLVKKYPDNVKIFNTSCLNTEKGVQSILSFAEVKNPRLITNIKKNGT